MCHYGQHMIEEEELRSMLASTSGTHIHMYPFIKGTGHMGKFSIEDDVWENVMLKINKNCIKNEDKICVYRNMEYHVKKNIVVQKIVRDVVVKENGILVVLDKQLVDAHKMPILNEYHNEYNVVIYTHYVGVIKILMVIVDNKHKYIELQINLKNMSSDTIEKIVGDIDVVYKNFMRQND